MIEGVQLKPLSIYHDDRGFLLEVVKEGDPLFREIKQTTYTEAYPGVIKAFHWHHRQEDLWFFTSGMARGAPRPAGRISHPWRNERVLPGGGEPGAPSHPSRCGSRVPGARPQARGPLLSHNGEVRPRTSGRGTHGARRSQDRLRLVHPTPVRGGKARHPGRSAMPGTAPGAIGSVSRLGGRLQAGRRVVRPYSNKTGRRADGRARERPCVLTGT